MQTLYGCKTLTPHLKLSPYRKKPLELYMINLRIVIQIYCKKNNILKFEDKILINIIILISKSINNLLQANLYKATTHGTSQI